MYIKTEETEKIEQTKGIKPGKDCEDFKRDPMEWYWVNKTCCVYSNKCNWKEQRYCSCFYGFLESDKDLCSGIKINNESIIIDREGIKEGING